MTNKIYDFELKDYRGNSFKLDLFMNKVMIIVNVASQCGLSETSYKKMKEILDTFGNKVVLILCPCKQFLNQEFDNIKDIAEFVKIKLEGHLKTEDENIKVESSSVTVDDNVVLTEAIHVKGSKIDPLFDFLTSQKGGFLTKSIKWNFSSFLISKSGEVVERYSPMSFISSRDENLIKAVSE